MRVRLHPSGMSMQHQRFDKARDHLGVMMHPSGKSMPQQPSEKQVYENVILLNIMVREVKGDRENTGIVTDNKGAH